MSMNPLGDDLRERLIGELDENGRGAVDSLDAARDFLVTGVAAPQLSHAVATCIRNSVDAILDSAGTSDAHRWERLSREGVASYRRYRAQRDHNPLDTAEELRDLEACMNALDHFHSEPPRAERRLTEVVLRVTGQVPLRGKGSAFEAFLVLRDSLNSVVHGSHSKSAESLWNDCVRALRGLFLPPEARDVQLESLARHESPGLQEVAEVVGLATTPVHMRRFLNAVTSLRWLEMLGEQGHLDPPDGREMWSAREAVLRFAADCPDAVAHWLDTMYRKHRSHAGRVVHIARVAEVAAGPSLGIVLDAVKAHTRDRDIVSVGYRMARSVDAADPRVQEMADILLNEDSWPLMNFPNPLLKGLVDGADASNAAARCGLLFQKIAKVPEHDNYLLRLDLVNSESISDPPVRINKKRCPALVSSLLELIARCWEWLTVDDLLAQADRLDLRLSRRSRAWILANAPEVAAQQMVDEIAGAIPARSPTSDDLALIDRAVASAGASAAAAAWADAFGDAPTVGGDGHDLTAEDAPIEWLYRVWWLSLVPPGTSPCWEPAVEILSNGYGLDREALERRADQLPGPSSPFSVEELNSMPVDEAAQTIAAWRPARSGWPRAARELASTLGHAVAASPDTWLAHPVATVKQLHHPLYINHYLHAVSKLAPEHNLSVGPLLDAVLFARTHPWPPQPLETSGTRVEAVISSERSGVLGGEWSDADRSGIDLIRDFVVAGCAFEGRVQDVWGVLSSAARTCSQNYRPEGPDHFDHYERAINQTCTRALETAVLLAGRLLILQAPCRRRHLSCSRPGCVSRIKTGPSTGPSSHSGWGFCDAAPRNGSGPTTT